MKRVLITGSGGAGKSTFALALHKKLGLPVIHLDYHFHQKDKDYLTNKDAWIEKITDLLNQDTWIIDGNYSSTYKERFAHADTIIFLDVSTWATVTGVFKRRWQYRAKRRPDMPASWREKIEGEFLRYVIRFRKDSRPKLMREIEQYSHKDLDVHIFKSRKLAYAWLNSL